MKAIILTTALLSLLFAGSETFADLPGPPPGTAKVATPFLPGDNIDDASGAPTVPGPFVPVGDTIKPNIPNVVFYNFGTISNARIQPIRHDFVIRNNSHTVVYIDRVQPSCSCTTVSIDAGSSGSGSVIRPGITFTVHVSIDPKQLYTGAINKIVWIRLVGQTSPSFTMHISGNETSMASFNPEMLELGAIKVGHGPVRHVTVMTDSSVYGQHPPDPISVNGSLKITRDSSPPTVRASSIIRSYLVTVSQKHHLGLLSDTIAMPLSDGSGRPGPSMLVTGTVVGNSTNSKIKSDQSAVHSVGKSGTAATVNGKDILLSDLKSQCMQSNGYSVLQELIDETLIDQAAKARRIIVTGAEVNSRRSFVRDNLGGQSLADGLHKHNMTRQLLDDSIRRQLELEAMIAAPIRPARHMRHVWHITAATLYTDPITDKFKTRTDIEALNIIEAARDQLKAGARFSDIARHMSDFADVRQNGGDLGILCEGAPYYSNLFPMARGLHRGEYSKQTIHSYAGYELIYVSSTAENHSHNEDKAYRLAAQEYHEQQLGDGAGLVLKALRSRARVVVFYDNSCSLPPSSEVAATVNGQAISIGQVENRALITVGPTVLKQMIESALIDQAARADGIIVSTADIAAKKAELVNRLGGQSLDDAVKHHGTTMSLLESELIDQVRLEKMCRVAAKPATHMRHVYHIAIASQDVGPFVGHSIPALPGGPPAPTGAQALAELQTIKDRLNAGAKFTDMAKRYSTDIFSKDNGGDLGILHDGTTINLDILKVALSLKKGEISTPFKSFFGYDIVYIESTEEDHPATEDSLYDEASNEYRDSQSDIGTENALRTLEQKSQVSIYFYPMNMLR